MVMNKIDMLDDFEPRIDRDEENKPIRVWLSAQSGVGIPQLFHGIDSLLIPEEHGGLEAGFVTVAAVWMELGRLGAPTYVLYQLP
ncbi:hypothetical protein MJI20_28340, partial [Salmonella enterica subsp. enterica serovar Anatum]|nr:hypothetical protein [Salmonella enterica subsp. enterica serovar Anatum]